MNQQSKQIWLATMNDDINTVENARMAQEKKDMQRQFEEVWREAAQEKQTTLQATRALQLRQFARQETHAGELTDEDSDKTEREADVRARLAPSNRRGTPIPEHVQLCRYNSSDTGALAVQQGSDNPKHLVAASDNRLVEWHEASETITPTATKARGTRRDGGEKNNPTNLDPSTVGNTATVPHSLNATPIVIMEPSKAQGNSDTATYSQHATTNATPNY